MSGFNTFNVRSYNVGGGAGPAIPVACTGGMGSIADETGAIYYAHDDDLVTCGLSSFHVTKRTPGGGTHTTTWDVNISSFGPLVSVWMALDAQSLYFASRGGSETWPLSLPSTISTVRSHWLPVAHRSRIRIVEKAVHTCVLRGRD